MQNPLLDLTHRDILFLHNILHVIKENGWPFGESEYVDAFEVLSLTIPSHDSTRENASTLIPEFCEKLAAKLNPFIEGFLSSAPVPIVLSFEPHTPGNPFNVSIVNLQQQEDQADHDTQGEGSH